MGREELGGNFQECWLTKPKAPKTVLANPTVFPGCLGNLGCRYVCVQSWMMLMFSLRLEEKQGEILGQRTHQHAEVHVGRVSLPGVFFFTSEEEM